jgi:invasion protein IalB
MICISRISAGWQTSERDFLMTILFPRSAAVALAGALLLAGASAQAQQAPAAGGAPAQQPAQAAQPAGPIVANLQAVQPDWTKVCGVDQASKKEICYTTRDFGAAAKEGDAPQPLLALAVYDPKADDNKIIRLLLPPGLMLKPGFRYSIDKGPVDAGAFEICFPNGCFAEAKVKKAVVDGMKKAEKMMVVVKNQANAEVTFYLPLANFGKAFDGPAIDPKVLEEQQKKLQEELQKKAEEERKKLEAKGAAAAPKK